MKKVIFRSIGLSAALFLFNKTVFAQQNIGINNPTPDASAVLDIAATDKGLLIPRLTKVQRLAITAPAAGLMVFQTDDATGFWYYSTTGAWTFVNPTGADNLGNHTLSQNLNTNGKEITGGAVAGLGIASNGLVNIGSAARFYNGNFGGSNQVGLILNQADEGLIATGTLNYGSGTLPPYNSSDVRFIWSPFYAAFRMGKINAAQWDATNIGYYSVALGENTTAKGNHSFATGYNASAIGSRSFAAGENTSATGTNSFVAGLYSTAAGDYSTALGSNNNSSGSNSVALGTGNTSDGLSSIAIGTFNSTSGSYAVALGNSNLATGTTAIAMGSSTTAGNNYATASGYFTTANGPISVAMGDQTLASGNTSTAIGRNTIASGNYAMAAGSFTTASGEASIALGGSTTASGSYALATGLNSTASGYAATALGSGSNASGDYATAIGRSTTASGQNSTALGRSTTASGENSIALGYRASTNQKTGSVVIGDGNLQLNSSANYQMMMLFSGGYVFYTGFGAGVELSAGSNAWSTISDSTRKENFAPVNGEDFLQKIARFNLTSWNYKGQDRKTFRHYGPMAQDFYAAFGTDKFGTIGNDSSINQADFDGINLIAIQALEKRTADLKKENEQLKELLSEMVNDKPKTAALKKENKLLKARFEKLENEVSEIKVMLQTSGNNVVQANNEQQVAK